jgi:hypothetical protein
MFRDDEIQLQADALGVIRALRESAIGVHSQQSLEKAFEVLAQAGPDPDHVPDPTNVGVRRRESDFKKLQELLLQLSWCPGAVRKDIILTMMLITKAENEWVTTTDKRATPLGRFRRRRSDEDNPQQIA